MSKLVLFVMGWSTYDIEWPETIPGSNGWEYRTYNNFTDAEYEFSKWKFGSAWKTQKFKAMFLGQLDIDWETGQAQFHMEERMAWPAAKVVIYNKQDVVAKPAPESNISKLLKSKAYKLDGWQTVGGGNVPSYLDEFFAQKPIGEVPLPEPDYEYNLELIQQEGDDLVH